MSDAKDAGHPVVALNNLGWPTGPLTECVFERGGLHRFEECYAQWTYFLAHRIARLNPFRRIPFGASQAEPVRLFNFDRAELLPYSETFHADECDNDRPMQAAVVAMSALPD